MRRQTYLISLAAVGCGIFGVVHAQTNETPAAGVTVTQPANLSPEEKLEAARAIVARGTGLSERVTNLHSAALREADMIKITCLSDKLAQINANLRNAEGRLIALTNAVNAEVRDHEFTVVSVLGQRFTTLEQEANKCVGQEVFETGNSTNTTKIDGAKAGGATDASRLPSPPPPVIVGTVPAPVSSNG